MKSFALAALAAVVILTGCSLAGCKTAPTATEQSAVTVAVYIVAGHAIKRDDVVPAIWAARAARYKAAAVMLQTTNDAGDATIATLAADLAPLLDKLNPTDRLAADGLIAALTPYLQAQVDANPEVGYSRERLSTILAALIRACDAYIPKEPS